MTGRYLKIAEVCELLNISRTHCYELITRGELPHVRLGNALRIPECLLDQYLASRAVLPPGQRWPANGRAVKDDL